MVTSFRLPDLVSITGISQTNLQDASDCGNKLNVTLAWQGIPPLLLHGPGAVDTIQRPPQAGRCVSASRFSTTVFVFEGVL